MNGLFGKVSCIIGIVLVLMGVVVVVLGCIPIPYPKVIHYDAPIRVLGPTRLDFSLEAGTRKNITYYLSKETYLDVGLLKSNIDFYVSDSVGNIVFDVGRVIGEHSFVFKTSKNDNYTLYFDNTFDKVNNKTISCVLEAYYLLPETMNIYFELNPFFLMLGQAVYFFGVQLIFRKTFPYMVAFCSGLFVAMGSFFLFVRSDWFIISLLTILVSSTYISHKLNSPENAFKILFSSAISTALTLLWLTLAFPASIHSLLAKSVFEEIPPNFIFSTLIVIAALTFVAIPLIIAGLVLSQFLPEKRRDGVIRKT